MAAPEARIRTMRTGGIGEDSDPDVWWGSGGGVGGAGGSREKKGGFEGKEGGSGFRSNESTPSRGFDMQGEKEKGFASSDPGLGS